MVVKANHLIFPLYFASWRIFCAAPRRFTADFGQDAQLSSVEAAQPDVITAKPAKR